MKKSNIEKYMSYKEAWGRIDASINAGFFLEAITIEESIISDRLLSHLHGIGVRVSDESHFPDLLRKWIHQLGDAITPASQNDDDKQLAVLLHGRIFNWKNSRNMLVHSMVKSKPGKAPIPVEEFMMIAESTAREGEKHARDICNWHRKQLRKSVLS